jgi:hypothetical protein
MKRKEKIRIGNQARRDRKSPFSAWLLETAHHGVLPYFDPMVCGFGSRGRELTIDTEN